LDGKLLEANHMRAGFTYPGFLLGVMGLGGGLSTAALVQFGLVAATAAFAALSLSLVMTPLGDSRAGRATAGILILLLSLAVAGFLPAILYATAITAETVYTLLATASLALALLCLFGSLPGRVVLICYPLACLCAALAVYAKPHWAAAALLIGLVLTIAVARRSDESRLARGLSILAALVLVSGAVLKERAYVAGPAADAIAEFAPRTLFCNHLDLILPLLDQQATQKTHGTAFIAGLRKQVRSVVEKGPTGGWKLLGFNGDKCMYNSPIPVQVTRHFKGDKSQIRAFYRGLFLRAVAQSPIAYGHKVLKQVDAVLILPLAAHPWPTQSQQGAVRWLADKYPQHKAVLAADRDGPDLRKLFLDTGAVPPLVIVREAQRLFDFLGWGLWIAGALALIAEILITGGIAAPLRRAWPMIFTLGVFLAGTVVVALAHTFDISRYSDALAPIYGVAAGAACAYMLSVVFGRRGLVRARRSASP
jgi:hypothetical protein